MIAWWRSTTAQHFPYTQAKSKGARWRHMIPVWLLQKTWKIQCKLALFSMLDCSSDSIECINRHRLYSVLRNVCSCQILYVKTTDFGLKFCQMMHISHDRTWAARSMQEFMLSGCQMTIYKHSCHVPHACRQYLDLTGSSNMMFVIDHSIEAKHYLVLLSEHVELANMQKMNVAQVH